MIAFLLFALCNSATAMDDSCYNSQNRNSEPTQEGVLVFPRTEYYLVFPGMLDKGGEKVQMYNSPGSGVSLGLSFFIPLKNRFAIESTGIVYVESFSMKSSMFNSSDTGLEDPSAPEFSRIGFRLPVFANMQVCNKRHCIMNVFAGPSVDWAIANEQHIDFKYKGKNALLKTSASEFNRFNLYAEGGVTYKYDKDWSQWRLSIAYGLLNQSSLANTSFHTWRISLGYDF